MEYTIEQSDSGWDIFQSDSPTARYKGKRLIAHAAGGYENAYARLLEILNSNRSLRDALQWHGEWHGGLARGAANFDPENPTKL